MSCYIDVNDNLNTLNILKNLFTIYDRVMVLKLYVDYDDNELKNKYLIAANTHNNKLLNEAS